jgi:hypothetical protein
MTRLTILMLFTTALYSQFGGSFVLPVEDEALGYTKPANDPIARLEERLERNKANLHYREPHGYLLSLLQALDIPVSSQVLVFSKTSFQQNLIAPVTPRALYFNDDVYIGYVQHGDVLEIAAQDPTKGAIFYTLDQRPGRPVRFVRRDECLQCHASPRTLGVPGHIMRSVYPDGEGFPQLQAGGFTTTHSSPMAERWGGWFVTGTHGAARHMGNVWVSNKDQPEQLDRERGANRRSLQGLVDTRPYPAATSDIVALSVLAHQYHLHNLITRVSYETRLALSQQEGINKALGRPLDEWSDSTRRRIFGGAEAMLKYMLFAGEPPLTEPLTGAPEFQRDFLRLARRDSRGRSLREFDLKTRLFRYPVSFLVYTEAFDNLPLPVREYVYRRWRELLTSPVVEKDYAHLASAERQAAFEILRDTKPEFAAWLEKHPTSPANH